MVTHINFMSIILGALSRVVLVALWWSPILFLKRWMKLTGQTSAMMKRNQMKGATFAIVGSLVMAAVFYWLLWMFGLQTISGGVITGLLIWTGFVFPPMLSPVVYEGKSFKLFLINAGFQLVALLVMGAVLPM